MAEIRLLGPGDEVALEAFLATRPDTSMFLRSNLHLSGIVHTGQPYTADYVAALDEGHVVGVAAHSWGGNLLVEADDELPELVRRTVEASKRPVAGVIAAASMAQRTLLALGFESAPRTTDSLEDLFALDLSKLIVPERLERGAVRCRAPEEGELETVIGWRAAYEVETLGKARSPALERQARDDVERYQRDRRHFVLEEDGRIVSYSAFNAVLPDCVQIGGVFTPPEFRSGKRARSVVAGSLLFARRDGVRRSLLFTATGNRPAQRAYRALGFERVGDYAIVLFAEPQRLR